MRSVNGMSYTNAVIILFVVTFVIGTIIYPTYRVTRADLLQEYRDFKPEGMFEMKEHLLALSLALLPIYWLFWHRAPDANRVARGGSDQHTCGCSVVGLPDRSRHQQHPRVRIMTKAERLAAIFGIAFAVIYAPTMDFNWTLATYHPIQGIWQLGRARPSVGASPAMYWYGFVFTSALGALS